MQCVKKSRDNFEGKFCWKWNKFGSGSLRPRRGHLSKGPPPAHCLKHYNALNLIAVHCCIAADCSEKNRCIPLQGSTEHTAQHTTQGSSIQRTAGRITIHYFVLYSQKSLEQAVLLYKTQQYVVAPCGNNMQLHCNTQPACSCKNAFTCNRTQWNAMQWKVCALLPSFVQPAFLLHHHQQHWLSPCFRINHLVKGPST